MRLFYVIFITTTIFSTGDCKRLDLYIPVFINSNQTLESPLTTLNNQKLLLELRSYLIELMSTENKTITGRFLPPFETDDLSKWWTQKLKLEIDGLTITKLIFKLIVYKIIVKTVIILFLILVAPSYKAWKEYEKSFFSTSTTTTTTTTASPVLSTEVYDICKKYGWYCPPDYDSNYYYYD